MKIAIVYDSRTGSTRRAAEIMAESLRDSGHEVTVESVREADPSAVSRADAILIGSWTQGLFFILQHPTRAIVNFIDRLAPVRPSTTAAVFCTYKTSPGRMLDFMAARLRKRGANVTGQFRSRGPKADGSFFNWAANLAA